MGLHKSTATAVHVPSHSCKLYIAVTPCAQRARPPDRGLAAAPRKMPSIGLARRCLLTLPAVLLGQPRPSPAAPAGRFCAPGASLLDGQLLTAGAVPAVLDLAGYLDDAEVQRLTRIISRLEEVTSFRLRVLTRDRASPDWARDSRAIQCVFDLSGNSILMTADRGIAGALEAGSAFLSFDVGPDARLALPDVFVSRLVNEYARRPFVAKRGEAASIVVASEIIITCLRSEDGFCLRVPRASDSYF